MIFYIMTNRFYIYILNTQNAGFSGRFRRRKQAELLVLFLFLLLHSFLKDCYLGSFFLCLMMLVHVFTSPFPVSNEQNLWHPGNCMSTKAKTKNFWFKNWLFFFNPAHRMRIWIYISITYIHIYSVVWGFEILCCVILKSDNGLFPHT